MPDKFYEGGSQEKTHLLRPEFFLLLSPLDRARSVLTCRAMCSVAGRRDPVVWVFFQRFSSLIGDEACQFRNQQSRTVVNLATIVLFGTRGPFIYGSTARQEERAESDVDLMIIGDVGFSEVAFSLERAQTSLTRDINPTIFPVDEFRSKLARSNHFLTTVLREKKLFIIGDENELAKLASKRAGGRTQEQQGRDRRSTSSRRA